MDDVFPPPDTSTLGDRPVTGTDGDRLDRGPFVASLVATLVRPETNESGRLSRAATGFVVGLTGEWGTGKSTVLNLVAEELEAMPFVAVARLNPWLFNGRDELIAAYFTALRSALGRSAGELGRDLLSAVDAYRSSIGAAGRVSAAVADAHGGGGWFSWGWRGVAKSRELLPDAHPRTADEERASLEGKLRRLGVATVVLIDELDRVEDDEVRAVAQLIKAVGDIAGISYLVAYDPERVADALGRGVGAEERRRSGEAYLEKIVQYSVPVRPLFREDVDILLASALAEAGAGLPQGLDEGRAALLEAVILEIRTPREVKRLAGTFAVLEAAVNGEVDPVDVFAYSWISVKSPNLRALMAKDFERLVDDPGQPEMMRRLRGRRLARGVRDDLGTGVVDELGAAAQAHSGILELLFPRFQKNRRGRPNGSRVAHRRNLVRLLYLGNPPGMTARSDVERLWTSADRAGLEDELGGMLERGRLRPMIARLGDLRPSLPVEGGEAFWVALSHVLRRERDWADRYDERRAAVEDAAELLMDAGAADGPGRRAASKTVEELIGAGDLLIVPWLLRRHMFVHGLTSHGEARGGERMLGVEETIALYDRELPRYRAAVLDGTMLRRLPDVELMFCVANRAGWDTELRTSLTEQLDGAEALATLASLLVPEGWSIDHASLVSLFDVEVVKARLDALLASGSMSGDDWIADAVRRFSARLADPRADAGTLA